MSTIASLEEYALYDQLNAGLAALRKGDWGLADKIARQVQPRVNDGEPHRPDVAAIALLKKEISASGRKP